MSSAASAKSWELSTVRANVVMASRTNMRALQAKHVPLRTTFACSRCMTTPDQRHIDEPRSSEVAPNEGAGAILLIIFAVVCGAAAVGLTVFGVWPALLLLIFAAMAAMLAKKRLKRA